MGLHTLSPPFSGHAVDQVSPSHGLTSFAASAESPRQTLCFHIWKMGICR